MELAKQVTSHKDMIKKLIDMGIIDSNKSFDDAIEYLWRSYIVVDTLDELEKALNFYKYFGIPIEEELISRTFGIGYRYYVIKDKRLNCFGTYQNPFTRGDDLSLYVLGINKPIQELRPDV